MSLLFSIKFGYFYMLQKFQDAMLIAEIKQIKISYHQSRFQINFLLVVVVFESIQGCFIEMQISLNKNSQNKHFPEIQQYIFTVNERKGLIYHTLPFSDVTTNIIINVVYNSVFVSTHYRYKMCNIQPQVQQAEQPIQ